MIMCTVCSEWYRTSEGDRLDICPDCYRTNFAGAQPPLDVWASARDALDAFVDTAHALTPRQVQALRRLAARWQQAEGEA